VKKKCRWQTAGDESFCEHPANSKKYNMYFGRGDCVYLGSEEKCVYFEKVSTTDYDGPEKATEKRTCNAVHSPTHYNKGGVECIKALESWLTPEEYQGFCCGNVIKYVCRWRSKDGLQDLEKAKVYLEWLIESAKRGCENAD